MAALCWTAWHQPEAIRRATALAADRGVTDRLARVPLAFERNDGHFPRDIDFVVNGRGATVALVGGSAVFASQQPDASGTTHAFAMTFTGGATRRPQAQGRLPWPVHRIKGTRTDTAQVFERVVYEDVYNAVDVVYRGTGPQLEFDLVVAPGADPRAIALRFDGADVAIEPNGDLIVSAGNYQLRQHKPVAFQGDGVARREIAARFVRTAHDAVAFELGAYHRGETLVIDPAVSFSTYLGGVRNDAAVGVAVDRAGAAYVTGYSVSTDFPVTPGAVACRCDPHYRDVANWVAIWDIFVVKLAPGASTLVYATFVDEGNQRNESALDIALDPSGRPVILGERSVLASSLPWAVFVRRLAANGAAVDMAAYVEDLFAPAALAIDAAGQMAFVARTTPAYVPSASWGRPAGDQAGDVAIVKLTSDGQQLFSALLGGSSVDEPGDVAFDAAGDIVVTGTTRSLDFPTTSGALAPSPPSPGCGTSGSMLLCASGFVARVRADGTGLQYSTYFGSPDANDKPTALAADSNGDVIVAGYTESRAFPSTSGALNSPCPPNGPCESIFVSRFSPAGALMYSARLAGARNIDKVHVALGGGVYLAATVTGNALPVVHGFHATAPSGPVLTSADNFLTATPLNLGMTCGSIAHLAVAGDVIYAVDTAGTVCGSRNAGASWQTLRVGSASSGRAVLAVDPVQPNTVYLVDNTILKSVDGGVTWATRATGIPTNDLTPFGAGGFGPRIAVRPDNPSVLFVSARSGVFRSTDGSATWQRVVTAQPLPGTPYLPFAPIGIAPSDPNIVYTNGFKSTDGGASWVANEAPPTNSTRGLAVDPLDPQIVYAFGEFGAQRSLAGGTAGSWSDLGIAAYDLLIDPVRAGRLYVTTRDGLYSSDDSGATWRHSAPRLGTWSSVLALGGPVGGASRVYIGRLDATDVYLARLNASASAITWASYLGGASSEAVNGFAVGPNRSMYLAGYTGSTTMARGRAPQPVIADGAEAAADAWIARIDWQPKISDLDDDAFADPAIFSPAAGRWSFLSSRGAGSQQSVIWGGLSTDRGAAGDYDGDGQVDLALFRPYNGYWYILRSSTHTGLYIQWGGSTDDIPAPADYDGDGVTDVAVFRPSNGYWYIRQSTTNAGRYIQLGANGDVPLPGDYDGDGITDLAVFRPSTGDWFLQYLGTGVTRNIRWGTANDLPARGDFDGDGTLDLAVFRRADGYWYILQSSTGRARYINWGGRPADIPAAADYDGDNITDVAFLRPTDGYYYILQSATRTPRYSYMGWIAGGMTPTMQVVAR